MASPKVHIIYLSLLALSILSHFSFYEQLEETYRGPASESYKMIGNLERIHIGENKDLQFYAKIDSGAESSSIHAENISTFYKEENGSEILYVKFDTIDEHNQKKTFERPVVKIDDVKSALGKTRRFFVQEKIWIGDDYHFVNVNLADRSHMKRKFLIGKNVLDSGYYINTSEKMLVSH